ncbi:hypothetical protein CRYUN_Cryun11dG0097500 [Craigia yunnanensis]
MWKFMYAAEAIVLGFQHYQLTLGITVLIPSIIVPQMGGGNAEKAAVMQNLLFVSELSTLFQSLLGTRLPTVVVGSYAYLIPVTSIIQASRYNSYSDPYELAKCVEVGLPGIIVMVFISQYLPRYIELKQPICDRFAVLFTVAVTWLFAQLLTSTTVYKHKPENTQISCRTDRAGLISTAPCQLVHSLQLRDMEVLHLCHLLLLAVVLVGWEYGFCSMACLVLLLALLHQLKMLACAALTRVGSRRVIQLPAGFMIFFSVFAKFGAFFASIPLPIVAALYCVLFGFVSSAGLSFLQFCNLKNFKTKFILGFSFFMGLSVPQYFREYYHGGWRSAHPTGWFSDVVLVIFMSHTTVAALVALFFDLTLSRENDETKKDSGLKWGEKFSLYKADVRNDEFYALPCSLNKLFSAL